MEEKNWPTQQKEPPNSTEKLEAIDEEPTPLRANFPVFIKLIVTLLIFAFLPFLLVSLAISWSYDASFRELIKGISLFEEEQLLLEGKLAQLEHNLRIQIGFLFLLSASFMIAGVWIASRILVKPLGNFLENMGRLSHGEFTARMRGETSDEFGIAADYFNRLSKHLELFKKREQWISRMKSQLLALAAHQLRTPLTAIQWIFNGLESGDYGKVSKRQQEALRKGVSSAQRMIRVISALLDITAIEEGRFGYHFQSSDISQIMGNTIQEHRVLANAKEISIEVRTPSSLPLVYIDPQKIKLVLDNLLSNAIRYTQERGRVSISASVRQGKEHKEIVVSVQDTGIGITKEELEKVFTRFFRTKEAMEMYAEGSGLGLFIAKNIMRRHGGDIWVQSEKGKGATFTIALPVSKEQIPREEPAEQFFLG